MKNNNLTLLDNDQLIRAEHDQDHDAKRVIIVGGDAAQIAQSVKEGLKDLKMDFTLSDEQIAALRPAPAPVVSMQPEIQFRTIEVPVIVKEIEYRTIEVPVTIKETEIKVIEIEKQVIVKEIEIREIEKHIFIYKSSQTLIIKCLLVIQVAASITLGFLHFFHK